MESDDQKTNPETDKQNPTPPEGAETGTTPPGAEQTGSTQPAADEGGKGEALDPETVEKIVKKRLDRERKKWQQEREEAEERARMSEAERLKADLDAKDAELAAAKADAQAARRQAQLAGRVRDPRAAIKLLEDDHLDADGNVDVDALLEAYPFLAPESGKPSAASATAPQPASGAPAKNPWARETRNLTEQARLLRENPKLAATLKAAAEDS